MSCRLRDVLIHSITFPPGIVYDRGSMAGVRPRVCLLKQCYPAASAASGSAVFMLCQGETLGHRLLHQPFLLWNRTMNTGC